MSEQKHSETVCTKNISMSFCVFLRTPENSYPVLERNIADQPSCAFPKGNVWFQLIPNFQLSCFCFSWSWLLHWEKTGHGSFFLSRLAGAKKSKKKHWWNFLIRFFKGLPHETTPVFFFCRVRGPPGGSCSADHCRWFARHPLPLWLTHRGQRCVLASNRVLGESFVCECAPKSHPPLGRKTEKNTVILLGWLKNSHLFNHDSGKGA